MVVYDGGGRVQTRRCICYFFIHSNSSVVTRSSLLLSCVLQNRCCFPSCVQIPSRAVSTVYAIQLYMKIVIPYHLWYHLSLTIVCQPHPYHIFMHFLSFVDSSMKRIETVTSRQDSRMQQNAVSNLRYPCSCIWHDLFQRRIVRCRIDQDTTFSSFHLGELSALYGSLDA